MDVTDVRRANLRHVLEAVRGTQPTSQNDLVAHTGLASGAVSSLVNELLQHDVLTELSPVSAAGRGRPKRAVDLADRRADLIGVVVTRHEARARAATLRGRVLSERSMSFSATPSAHEVRDAIARLTDEVAGADVRPGGPRTAISLPAARKDDGLASVELDWHGVSPELLIEPLRSRGWSEPLVGNDASFATIAEARFGAARGYSNAVVFFLGYGLGGSAVIDNQLIRGAVDAPGFGHTPLDPTGPVCFCGLRGCAGLFVSLHQFAMELGDVRGDVRPDQYASELRARAVDGDAAVLSLFDEARIKMSHLGDIAASLLNPEIIVLTGVGSILTPWLTPRVVGDPPVRIIEGTTSGDAPLRGAVAVAQDLFIEAPLSSGER